MTDLVAFTSFIFFSPVFFSFAPNNTMYIIILLLTIYKKNSICNNLYESNSRRQIKSSKRERKLNYNWGNPLSQYLIWLRFYWLQSEQDDDDDDEEKQNRKNWN